MIAVPPRGRAWAEAPAPPLSDWHAAAAGPVTVTVTQAGRRAALP